MKPKRSWSGVIVILTAMFATKYLQDDDLIAVLCGLAFYAIFIHTPTHLGDEYVPKDKP